MGTRNGQNVREFGTTIKAYGKNLNTHHEFREYTSLYFIKNFAFSPKIFTIFYSNLEFKFIDKIIFDK